MLTELTKEQEQIMLQTRDKWNNLFFDNVKNKKGIDREKFEKGINWIYESMLKKENPKILYCQSWIEALLTIVVLKDGANVRANVRDNVRANVWANVRDNVRANVWANVLDNVRDNVRANVWANVWDNVGDNVRDNVRANVGAKLKDIFYDYSSYLDITNFGWVSFYDFFEEIGVLNDELFKLYRDFIQSNAFVVYAYESIVLAVDPPIYIERNQEGRLHSVNRAAFEFKDGTKYYFINGRSIPSWIIEEKDTITKEMFLSEKNEEIKAAIFEVLGPDKILDLIGSEVVDTKEIHHQNGDVETVSLIKTKDYLPGIGEKLAFVRLACPSTGTNYLIGVQPNHTDAREAVASLSPFTSAEYSYNYRT